MKALFYKDITMALRHYWFALILTLCGFAMALMGDSISIGIISCLMFGMLSTSTYVFDEKSRWVSYSATLPYSSAQIVSEKYIFSLVVSVANSLILTLGSVLNVYVLDSDIVIEKLDHESILFSFMIYLIISLVWGVTMPVMFRFGSEKSRWFFSILGGICGACMALFIGFSEADIVDILNSLTTIASVALGIVVLLYIGSWLLSIKWYKKRAL